MKRIAILTTNDLIADQRVHRTATTLIAAGYAVKGIGRSGPQTPLNPRLPYPAQLLALPFHRGWPFYLTYNLGALALLLRERFHGVLANDLDTLLAARLACWLKRIPLVYDSHELFSEQAELVARPRVRGVWIGLERLLTRNLRHCSTVSDGVALELRRRYGLAPVVIRNMPTRKEPAHQPDGNEHDRVIMYQGALSMGRGLEKLIEAMGLLPQATLRIAGNGYHEPALRALALRLGLSGRVQFLGRLPLDQLHRVTCTATIGVSLEEDMGLNYRYALPNKIFDYIQAGLPVLVSNLPEMAALVRRHGVGEVIGSACTPAELAHRLHWMISDGQRLAHWREQSRRAAQALTWENERHKLVALFAQAMG